MRAARFSNAQCGFKAARTEVVQALLPVVEDEEWFLRHRVAAARRMSRPAGANAFHVRDAGPPPSGGERELYPAGDVISEFVEFRPHRG
jgi:hypothetical protein